MNWIVVSMTKTLFITLTGEFLKYFSFSLCVRFTYNQYFLIKKQVIKLVICTRDFLRFIFNNFLKTVAFLCTKIFTETFSKASEKNIVLPKLKLGNSQLRYVEINQWSKLKSF